MSTTISIEKYINQGIRKLTIGAKELMKKWVRVKSQPKSKDTPRVVRVESSTMNAKSINESNSMCSCLISLDIAALDMVIGHIAEAAFVNSRSSTDLMHDALSVDEEDNRSTRTNSWQTTKSFDSITDTTDENKFAIVIYTGSSMKWNVLANMQDIQPKAAVTLVIKDKLPLLAIEDAKETDELNYFIPETTKEIINATDKDANDEDDIFSISSASSCDSTSSEHTTYSQMPGLVELTNDQVLKSMNHYDIRRHARLNFASMLVAQGLRRQCGSIVKNGPVLRVIQANESVSLISVGENSKHVPVVPTMTETVDDHSSRVPSKVTMPSPQFVLPMFPSIKFQGLFAPVTDYSPPNFGNHAWFHPEEYPTNAYFPIMPLKHSNRPMNQPTCYA